MRKILLKSLLLAAILLAPAQAQELGYYKVADGVAVYVGVLPAEMLRRRPPASHESSMHGGVPAGKDYHHVVVAVFDSKSGERIANARIRASVAELGFSARKKVLEPMIISDVTSYGNFFPMRGTGPFVIQLEIRRPGAAAPIRAEFEYSHPRSR